MSRTVNEFLSNLPHEVRSHKVKDREVLVDFTTNDNFTTVVREHYGLLDRIAGDSRLRAHMSFELEEYVSYLQSIIALRVYHFSGELYSDSNLQDYRYDVYKKVRYPSFIYQIIRVIGEEPLPDLGLVVKPTIGDIDLMGVKDMLRVSRELASFKRSAEVSLHVGIPKQSYEVSASFALIRVAEGHVRMISSQYVEPALGVLGSVFTRVSNLPVVEFTHSLGSAHDLSRDLSILVGIPDDESVED